jgi:GTPase SAR1 family protein
VQKFQEMGNSGGKKSGGTKAEINDPHFQEKVAQSKQFDQMATKMMRKDMEYAKLLLLGAGESGKSTLFKQMITLYGKGFSEQDREKLTDVVNNNAVEWMKRIVEQTDTLSRDHGLNTVISDSLAAEKALISDPDLPLKVTPEIVAAWRKLERDPGVVLAIENRAKYQLGDSAQYFFSRLEDIVKPGYLPNADDVLRVRVKTTGLVETEFQLMENKFKLFDVGGQRSERKKWIHCFENVTGVIFVAAISEYDQVCAEDEKTNRIAEALTLFYETCNSKYLSNTAMILFLNKEDLLREKLTRVPLTVYDSNYTGKNDFESVSQYFQEKFLEQNMNPSRTVYVHVTCATNKDNVNLVFQTVKDIVLKESLATGGLI